MGRKIVIILASLFLIVGCGKKAKEEYYACNVIDDEEIMYEYKSIDGVKETQIQYQVFVSKDHKKINSLTKQSGIEFEDLDLAIAFYNDLNYLGIDAQLVSDTFIVVYRSDNPFNIIDDIEDFDTWISNLYCH